MTTAARKPKRSTSRRIAAPVAPPPDYDALRVALAQRLVTIVNRNRWRGCALKTCRRRRSCAAPGQVCANARPHRPATPEESAAAMADLQRALQRRLAELDAEP